MSSIIKENEIIKCQKIGCDQSVRLFCAYVGSITAFRCAKCLSFRHYKKINPCVGDYTNCKMCHAQFMYKDCLLCIVCKIKCGVV